MNNWLSCPDPYPPQKLKMIHDNLKSVLRYQLKRSSKRIWESLERKNNCQSEGNLALLIRAKKWMLKSRPEAIPNY